MQHIQNTDKKLKNEVKEQGKNNPLYFYPNEYISISALNSFENCPFNFYIRYYLGVKFPLPDRVLLGTQFQEILNAKYAGQDTNSLIMGMKESDRELASKLLMQATPFENIISIDSPYQVDLGFGIPVMFVPDLVIQGAVIENKYTSGYYNAKMVDDQKQGTLYYIGTKKIHGFEPKVIYQIFNKKNGKAKLIEISPKNQKNVNELLYWIDEKLRQIEKCHNTGIWDIKNHSYFDCDLGKSCPIKYKLTA